MGVLLLIGFILIANVALGFVYFQQGAQQKGLQEKINQLNLIVNKPLASDEKLRAEFDEINLALAPITNIVAVEMLVGIAEDSGINVDKNAAKLRIAPATAGEEKRGETTYHVLSFNGISVQGDYDRVMALIATLDSGETLKTMVLTRVDIKHVEVMYTDKGYNGTDSPRDGYVLYSHDMVEPGDDTRFRTVKYITTLSTTYYYTCESSGLVRQFDGADVLTATELLGTEGSKMETIATLDVKIYTKPR
jgi:hypothetical protein